MSIAKYINPRSVWETRSMGHGWRHGGLASVTLVCGSQRIVHLWSIANIDPTELFLTRLVAEVKDSSLFPPSC